MSPLTIDEKQFLLRLARRSMEAAVRPEPFQGPGEVPASLQEPCGAFVSLHREQQLRGCVGYVLPLKPLYQAVLEMAAAAALKDPRFAPVRPEELAELELEISVLSPLREVRPEEIQVGVHGVMITHGRARGLLLPQVPVEHQWSRERFLEETCRKAGLPRDAWQHGAKVEAFSAEIFRETLLAGKAKDHAAPIPTPPHSPEIPPRAKT